MTVAYVAKSTQLFADNASSIAPSLAVSAGHLAVLTVGNSRGDTTQTALSAPGGWSTAESTQTVYPLTYSAQSSIFYLPNTTATTLNPSISLPAGSYAQATITEFSGTDTSTPLDVHTSALAGGATSGNTGTTGTSTSADAVAVVVGHAEDRVGSTASLSSPAATGYTVIDTSANNAVHIACDFSYKILSATGTQQGSWTWTGSSDFSAAIAVFKGAAGGGSSAALTGVAGTQSPGTVAPSTAKAATGNVGTGSPGTATASTSKALTGNAGTGSVGTVAPSTTKALTGNGATGSVGTVTASVGQAAALTGVAGTGAPGTVGPQTAKAITGSAGTGSAGTVAPTQSLALSGVAGAGSAGSVAPSTTKALSGSPATGAVGTVTASTGITVALSGVSAAGQVGTVIASGGTQSATTGPGFEVGSAPRRIQERSFTPILQRVLAAKAARVKPVGERQQKRAKAIEQEAAAQLIDGTADEQAMRLAAARWMAQLPVLTLPQVDPYEVFLAQVLFRLQQAHALAQQQAEQQAIEAAARRRRQDEDAVLALLLA